MSDDPFGLNQFKSKPASLPQENTAKAVEEFLGPRPQQKDDPFGLSQFLSEPEKPMAPPPSRGVVADTGAALAAGSVDLAELLARAYRLGNVEGQDQGFGDAAAMWVIEKKKQLEKEYPGIFAQSKEAAEGGPRAWWYGGVRSAIPSLGAGIPGAALGMAGGPLGAAAGYVASGGTLFGLAEYDQFKEEILEHNKKHPEDPIPKSVWQDKALVSAFAQGGLEALNNAVEAASFKLGSVAFKGLKDAAKKSVGEMLKPTAKESLKTFAKGQAVMQPAEISTEMAQDYISAQQRGEAGLPQDKTPWQHAVEAIGPTAVMTVLFGAGGHVYNKVQRNSIAKALTNSDVPIDTRFQAAYLIGLELEKYDKANGTDLATKWSEAAVERIANFESIPLDENLESIPTRAEAEQQKETAAKVASDVEKFEARGKVEEATTPTEEKVESKPVQRLFQYGMQGYLKQRFLDTGMTEERADELTARIMGAGQGKREEAQPEETPEPGTVTLYDAKGTPIIVDKKSIQGEKVTSGMTPSATENKIVTETQGEKEEKKKTGYEDILSKAGTPFSSKAGATLSLKAQGLGNTYVAVPVADGKWVGRRKDVVQTTALVRGIPKAQQAAQSLTSNVLKGVGRDRPNIERVAGEVRGGQEPVQTGPVTGTSAGSTAAGRTLQTPKPKRVTKVSAPVAEVQAPQVETPAPQGEVTPQEVTPPVKEKTKLEKFKERVAGLKKKPKPTAKAVVERLRAGEDVPEAEVKKFHTLAIRWSKGEDGKWVEKEPEYKGKRTLTDEEREARADQRAREKAAKQPPKEKPDLLKQLDDAEKRVKTLKTKLDKEKDPVKREDIQDEIDSTNQDIRVYNLRLNKQAKVTNIDWFGGAKVERREAEHPLANEKDFQPRTTVDQVIGKYTADQPGGVKKLRDSIPGPAAMIQALRTMVNHRLHNEGGGVNLAQVGGHLKQLLDGYNAGKLDAYFRGDEEGKGTFARQLVSLLNYYEAVTNYLLDEQQKRQVESVEEVAPETDQGELDRLIAEQQADPDEDAQFEISDLIGREAFTPDEVKSIIYPLLKYWMNRPEVRVYRNLREMMEETGINPVTSGVDVDTAMYRGVALFMGGRVYLFSDLMAKEARTEAGLRRSRNDVIGHLLHEVMGHYGLRGVLGKQRVPVLLELYDTVKGTREFREVVRNYTALDLSKPEDRALAVEETLSNLAKNPAVEKSTWQKVVDWFRSWAQKLGFIAGDSDVHQQMIHDILADARRWVIEPRGAFFPANVANIMGMLSAVDTAPWYFSKLEDVVANDKQLPKKAQSLKNYLAKFVKPAELDWMGFDDFIKGKQTVTREELLDFVKANTIHIREVLRQGIEPPPEGAYDQLTEEYQQYLNNEGLPQLSAEELLAEDSLSEDQRVWLQDFVNRWDEVDRPQPQQPQTPPRFFGAAENAEGFTFRGTIVDAGPTRFLTYTEPGGENYRELILQWADPTETLYVNSVHFPESNPLVHVRFKDRVDADGKKVLFIEEIQSDWHQAGKKQGYRDKKVEWPKYTGTIIHEPATPGKVAGRFYGRKLFKNVVNPYDGELLAPKGELVTQDLIDRFVGVGIERFSVVGKVDNAGYFERFEQVTIEGGNRERYRVDVFAPTGELAYTGYEHTEQEANSWLNIELAWRNTDERSGGGVEPAPFKDNWHELAMKRMIRWAAENGYDGVAWTTGKQQADRYNLSRYISRIHVEKLSNGQYEFFAYDHRGECTHSDYRATPARIEELVGEDVAKRVIKAANEAGPVKFRPGLTGRVLASEVLDTRTGDTIKEAGEVLTDDDVQLLNNGDVQHVVLEDPYWKSHYKYEIKPILGENRLRVEIIDTNTGEVVRSREHVESERLALERWGRTFVHKLDSTSKPEPLYEGNLYENKGVDVTDLDISVGGEGMKKFYDELLPGFAKRYLNQWGVKPQYLSINIQGKSLRLQELEQESQEAFSNLQGIREDLDRGYYTNNDTGEVINFAEYPDRRGTWERAEQRAAMDLDRIEDEIKELRAQGVPNLQHGFYLNDKMKRDVVLKGQPLWEIIDAKGRFGKTLPVKPNALDKQIMGGDNIFGATFESVDVTFGDFGMEISGLWKGQEDAEAFGNETIGIHDGTADFVSDQTLKALIQHYRRTSPNKTVTYSITPNNISINEESGQLSLLPEPKQKKIRDMAARKFGVTNDFKPGWSHWMMPNGQFIGNNQNFIHWDVQSVLEQNHLFTYEADEQMGTDNLKAVMPIFADATGSIRFRGWSNGDVSLEMPEGFTISQGQMSKLRDIRERGGGGNIWYDVTDMEGNILRSGETSNISEVVRRLRPEKEDAQFSILPGPLNKLKSGTPGRTVSEIFSEESLAMLRTIAAQRPSRLPHMSFMERMLKSPEWYDHPVLKRIVKHAIDRHDKFYQMFNDLNDLDEPVRVGDKQYHTIIDATVALRDNAPEKYKLLEKVIDEGDTGEWRDAYPEDSTVTYEEHLRNNNVPEEVMKIYKLHRAAYDKALDILTAPMRKLVADIEKDAEKKGETPKYPTMQVMDEKGERKTITLKEAVQHMNRWRGTYAPRIRDYGGWVVRGKKGEREFRFHRSNRWGAERLRNRLKREGFADVSVAEKAQMPETLYQNLRLVDTAKAIETALNHMSDPNSEAAAKFHNELIKDMADVIRMRGFRAAMIKRREGQAIKGYIEDPNERFIKYINSISAGMAKAETAKLMMQEITEKFETGEDGKRVKVGGINAEKEPRVYEVAQKYMNEQLRNADYIDRIIGNVKGVATFKYLGLNPRSILVNVLAVPTTVPPAIRQYALGGKGSFADIGREMSKAGVDFASTMRGGRLNNVTEQEFIDEMHEKGYAVPQYTKEAIGTIERGFGSYWQKTLNFSMKAFQVTEEWNRGTTMLAAYRLIKKQRPEISEDEARALAHETSNRAHGIYGKATLPEFAQGSGWGAKMGQLVYTYQKFSHNYLQMLYDTGFKKKDIPSFLWALLSPIVLGGAMVVPFKDAMFAVAGALLKAAGIDDDPEKWVWDWWRKIVGKTGEQITRHGALGAAGIDVSGSLSVGVGIPQNAWDVAGVVGGVGEDIVTAADFAKTGQLGRAAERVLPTGISNFLRAYREMNTGVVTTKGNRVFNDDGSPFVPSKGETALRFGGIRSANLATLQERTWEGKREEKRFADRRDRIFQRYRAYLADPKSDPKDFQGVMDEVYSYNNSVARTNKFNLPYITRETMRRQVKEMYAPNKKEFMRLSD